MFKLNIIFSVLNLLFSETCFFEYVVGLVGVCAGVRGGGVGGSVPLVVSPPSLPLSRVYSSDRGY